ncbi:MAG: FAD-dependent monooxygenase [Spirochaetia bacterium]|nr:FAD-dependent monooxygenase [Spirochaetia bacterium]
MKNGNFHVLIIGGGIAGPALALALKQAGIASSVFEAYPYGEGIGGGFNIAPNGTRILAQIGVLDDLVSKSTVARFSKFKDERGREMATLPYGDPARYGQPALTMSRATLFECLAQTMKQRGISAQYEKRLTSFEDTADGVVAYFADGSSARGDILVGADGVRSAVRNFLLPAGPNPEFTGMLGVCGFAPADAFPEIHTSDVEAITFTFGPDGFFGHGGGDTKTFLWWANMMAETPFTAEQISSIDHAAAREELLKRFGTYYAPIPSLIAKTPKILRQNTYDIQSLPFWHKGRVVLIGDAAHAVSPNSGQGASLALEDALFLANLLRTSERGYSETFAAFESARKGRVEKIVQEGRRRSKGKDVATPLQSRIRNFFIGIMIKLFGVKGQDEVFGYRVDWMVGPVSSKTEDKPNGARLSETGAVREISRKEIKMRAARPGYP